MCRFLAYQGEETTLDELLYKPKNSLIKQSASANEAEEPLNGDGFGVGWYSPEKLNEPGLYVSIRPAWNDRNLKYLSRLVKTTSLFAHVRAASEGEVSESNCHPFHFGKYLFMHNGGIGEFAKMKRYVRRMLSDEIYDWLRGQTDSEHLFGMILEEIRSQKNEDLTSYELADIVQKTIDKIQQIKAELGITECCYINCVLTNGKSMVAVRYVSDTSEKASTLYYSAGRKYECLDGVCRMLPDGKQKAVLVVSEKLTDIPGEWTEIPENSICIVDEKLNVVIRPMNGSADSTGTAKKTGRGFKPKSHSG